MCNQKLLYHQLLGSLYAFLKPGNYPALRAWASEGDCLGRGSQRHAPAASQPRAAQWQRQLQAGEMKASSVQIKHICFKMTGHGKGGKDVNYHGKRLGTVNKWGCGNVLPASAGPGAASKVGGLVGVLQGSWGSSNSAMGTTEGPGDPGAHGAPDACHPSDSWGGWDRAWVRLWRGCRDPHPPAC